MGRRFLWDVGVADPSKYDHMYYRVELRRPKSKDVGINRRYTQKLGHAAPPPPRTNTPIPTWVTLLNLFAIVQTVRAYA